MLTLAKKNSDDLFGNFDSAMESLFGRYRSSVPSVTVSTSFTQAHELRTESFTQAHELRTDELYQLWIDMPGVKREDVKLTVGDGKISAIGTRSDIKGEHSRTIAFSDMYDESNVEAKLENGVLYVKIPARDPTKKKKRQVEVK